MKQTIAAAIFLIFGTLLAFNVPSVAIAWVCAILLLTIYLFSFEIVPVDVAAASIMVLLGLTGLLAPWMGLTEGLVPTERLFDGFSSNAVISIIAVMIIGAGLDKTGIMSKVAAFILKIGGTTETCIIPIVSGTVGVISSFMQNVGATALFLPVVSRISARTGLPLSRLLMPMGFTAILGGTMTMIGSSPLILLNDLILTSNRQLPAEQQMETFSLFSVTPIGIALVVTGVAYFILAGRYVLPAEETALDLNANTMDYITKSYGITYEINEVVIPSDSPLVGRTLEDVENTYRVRVIAVEKGDGIRFGSTGVDRTLGLEAGTVMGVMAAGRTLRAFAEANRLVVKDVLDVFHEALTPAISGIAEVVIPPRSKLIGHSARDLWMRKAYGLSLLVIHRGGGTITQGEGVREIPLRVGDTLLCHTRWADLAHLESDRNFVVVTTEYPREEMRPQKVGHALFFFAIALGLVLFTDTRLSICLLTGAMGMVLSHVLSMDEAYDAVSWKTVFLLASLIPLGLAVEGSGTAAWVAEKILSLFGDQPAIWLLQATVAILATFFTLVMSNVGATVLLVPLAVNIAVAAGGDPAIFALTVAIATSNSFLIPTHQVNALIMGPGGYKVADFIRAGGVMTLLFLVVMLAVMNLLF